MVLLWVWLLPVVQAIGEKYCSSQNTGSGDGTSWLYQSNGWCSEHCVGSQYAIIQGAYCWCSESAPGSVVSLSDCSDPCIGYPAEKCGNKNQGLFQYLYLGQGAAPSITTSGSGATSSTSSTASSSEASVSSTSSTSSSTSSSISSTSSSSTSSSSATSSSSSSPDPSSSPTSSESTSSTTTSSESTSSTSSTSTTSTTSSSTSSTSGTSSTSTSSTSTSSTSTSTSSSSTSTTSSTSTSSSSSTSTTSSSSSSSSSIPTSTSPRPTTPVQTHFSTSVIGFTSVVYSVVTLTQTQTTLDDSSGNATTQLTQVSQRVTTMTMVVTSSSSATVVALAPSNVNKSSSSDSKDFWHSPGKVAGTFVAVGIVVLAIVLLLLWLFFIRPRKQRRDFEEQYNEAVFSPRRPDQSSGDSVNYGGNRSSSGSQGFVYADEKGIFEPTLRSKRPSFDDESLDFTTTQPVIMDQRLDPNQVLSEIGHSNSKVSLADDIDYSRKVLRVINE